MPVPETAKPAIPYPGNKTDQSAQKTPDPLPDYFNIQPTLFFSSFPPIYFPP